MGSNYMTDPVIFLIDTIVSLYILAVVIRFLFQWVRADFYNPISQFLVKITHPPLKLLRRFIPSVGKIDTSSIVLALGIQMVADFSILMLKGVMVSIPSLVVLSFTQLVTLLLNVFIFAIFARAILSWFDPGNYNPASSLLQSITEPLLSLCRKIIPDLGGIDLSPLAALVFLQLAKMMVLPPLNELASLIG
jgi:YggT family protein